MAKTKAGTGQETQRVLPRQQDPLMTDTFNMFSQLYNQKQQDEQGQRELADQVNYLNTWRGGK